MCDFVFVSNRLTGYKTPNRMMPEKYARPFLYLGSCVCVFFSPAPPVLPARARRLKDRPEQVEETAFPRPDEELAPPRL